MFLLLVLIVSVVLEIIVVVCRPIRLPIDGIVILVELKESFLPVSATLGLLPADLGL